MRKKFLFLYVMICMLGSTAYALPYTTKADVTVLMYHLISDNSDEWSDYCISSQTFENDIKTLLEKGYTFISNVRPVNKVAKSELNRNAFDPVI